jgi:hypothetical protein
VFFLDMKYRMFGQAVGKYMIVFGLCNVLTVFDPSPPQDYNGGFRFKEGGGGGGKARRDI